MPGVARIRRQQQAWGPTINGLKTHGGWLRPVSDLFAQPVRVTAPQTQGLGDLQSPSTSVISWELSKGTLRWARKGKWVSER